MQFNGVEITPESIAKTKQYYIDSFRKRIDDIESGAKQVNDPDSVIQFCLDAINEYNKDKPVYSVGFTQRAYYIQTGMSLALLA